jgi:hypothetical protein
MGYKRESKYHLITANFEEYDFSKLFNEEEENDCGIIWRIGNEGGKRAQNYNIGDIYLRNTGEVYQVVSNGVNKIWTLVANLMGPRGPVGEDGLRGHEGPAGPEGPEGPKGDTGALCRIVGSITSISQLPTPT